MDYGDKIIDIIWTLLIPKCFSRYVFYTGYCTWNVEEIIDIIYEQTWPLNAAPEVFSIHDIAHERENLIMSF